MSTAGRAAAKRFAKLKRIPPPEVIEVADLVNYHRHEVQRPRGAEAVALELRWDEPLPRSANQLVLQVGISTPFVHDAGHLAPLNLAVVVDVSGSMNDDRKIACVKLALRRFIRQLRPDDRLSLVAYCDRAAVVLPSQRLGHGSEALRAIDELSPSGRTNLCAGLTLGFEEVARHSDSPAPPASRVILLTDGLANVGVVDDGEIARRSKAYTDRGIDLTTIGVGNDFNHDLLDRLARDGRGTFHFVADQRDVEKVFVEEAQALMGIVARDVELTLEHGPGFEVAHVYGHTVEPIGNGFRVPLENFNFGMTRVVLVKLQPKAGTDSPAPGTVKAALTFELADGRISKREAAIEPLSPPSEGRQPVLDRGVRKNFTIAVMARAMRRMAECAQAKRLGEADRHVRRALDYAAEQYPNPRDSDLIAVRDMLRAYRKVLGSHIEAYRDL